MSYKLIVWFRIVFTCCFVGSRGGDRLDAFSAPTSPTGPQMGDIDASVAGEGHGGAATTASAQQQQQSTILRNPLRGSKCNLFGQFFLVRKWLLISLSLVGDSPLLLVTFVLKTVTVQFLVIEIVFVVKDSELLTWYCFYCCLFLFLALVGSSVDRFTVDLLFMLLLN